MTREVLDNFEDHIHSLRTEWHVMKEKWFHGEMVDPVFEGTVRDFCTFDETMQNVYDHVQVFMKGVEQLAQGMTVLSEGVAAGLSHANDSLIASDSCKLKEATNQIARSDAPHSAIAKLRRDMHFNILNPVRNHIANNKNLKVSLDIRRSRLIELNSAKKHFEDVQKKVPETDRRYVKAQSTFEAAKATFNDVDRHVFEWLYILEEYRGDILDSTLQTLKYLEYEFFASSAHAISTSLPSRMEFRPMVEMTPEHLEAQVEMELQKNEENEATVAGAVDTGIIDFSARLIDKKVKEDPGDEGPAVAVDPFSLSSLLCQGFEEGPARKALRKHNNNTQAAMDWLINGQAEEEEKRRLVSDGVRAPTTVKRVQKLKAMRRAQAEKLKEKKESESAAEADGGGRAPKDSSDDEAAASSAPPPKPPAPPAPPADLMDSLLDEPNSTTAARSSGGGQVDDLLGFDDKPAEPTNFSEKVDITALPAQLSFDTTRCEKQPLSAAVAAGLAQPRTVDAAATGWAAVEQRSGGMPTFTMPTEAAVSSTPSAAPTITAGVTPELLAAVQAATGQAGGAPGAVTPELLAAVQVALAQQHKTVPATAATSPSGYPVQAQPSPPKKQDAFDGLGLL
mmetsp:Transcript_16340/g.35724  ORF Transcript_16340/g.35724 Transcript_16340/m.35724 type:complete len:622 (+) Transcript_16340:140-2005(+)